jgi:hypothetical protein
MTRSAFRASTITSRKSEAFFENC